MRRRPSTHRGLLAPTLLLHPWSALGGASEATWAALEPIRRWGPLPVLDAPCLRDTDYAEALASVWDLGWDLLVVEHDLVPTLDCVRRLATCSGPVCAQAYPLHPQTTRLPRSVWSPKVWDGHRYLWVEALAERADAFGLGCTVLRGQFQRAVPASLWRRQPWWQLDTVLSGLARERRLQAHVHWPSISHLHGEPVAVPV